MNILVQQSFELQRIINQWYVADQQFVNFIKNTNQDQRIQIKDVFNYLNKKSLDFYLRRKLSSNLYDNIQYIFMGREDFLKMKFLSFYKKKQYDGIFILTSILSQSELDSLKPFIIQNILQQCMQDSYLLDLTLQLLNAQQFNLIPNGINQQIDYIQYKNFENRQINTFLLSLSTESLLNFDYFDVEKILQNSYQQILYHRIISKQNLAIYIIKEFQYLFYDQDFYILFGSLELNFHEKSYICSQISGFTKKIWKC
ncbi:hypothetical protein SS50377_24631 [Spironucleus salmonicida]|uniref:Uncharacterized protein n=1 Tax=Spironucleus salmonicida TaxID=348837 RepID=A0A9P8LQR0_9EUKA|nr:hypothetical protein SS50377_24631 [Spironucleus salmonicida]